MSTDTVGKEVQLYKRPEVLVNFDGTARMDEGYGETSVAAGSSTPISNITTLGLAPPVVGIAPTMPQTGPSQMSRLQPVSLQRQQQRPTAGSKMTNFRPNEQQSAAPGMNDGIGRMDQTVSPAMMPPGSNVVASQPVFVVSPAGSLQQGVMFAPPSSSQAMQHHGDQRDPSRVMNTRGKNIHRR